jgi:hypothetical protein
MGREKVSISAHHELGNMKAVGHTPEKKVLVITKYSHGEVQFK